MNVSKVQLKFCSMRLDIGSCSKNLYLKVTIALIIIDYKQYNENSPMNWETAIWGMMVYRVKLKL